MSYAVVQEHWKLVTNRDSGYVELFDIANDPYEQGDLKNERSAIVERLLAMLDQWKQILPANPSGPVFSVERNQPDGETEN